MDKKKLPVGDLSEASKKRSALQRVAEAASKDKQSATATTKAAADTQDLAPIAGPPLPEDHSRIAGIPIPAALTSNVPAALRPSGVLPSAHESNSKKKKAAAAAAVAGVAGVALAGAPAGAEVAQSGAGKGAASGTGQSGAGKGATSNTAQSGTGQGAASGTGQGAASGTGQGAASGIAKTTTGKGAASGIAQSGAGQGAASGAAQGAASGIAQSGAAQGAASGIAQSGAGSLGGVSQGQLAGGFLKKLTNSPKAMGAAAASTAAVVAGAAFLTLGGGDVPPLETPEDAALAFIEALEEGDQDKLEEVIVPADIEAGVGVLDEVLVTVGIDVIGDSPGDGIVFIDVTTTPELEAAGVAITNVVGTVQSVEDAVDSISPVDFDLNLVTVTTEDNNWRVSILHTDAEGERRQAGLPFPTFDGSVDAPGAATPEGAVENLVTAATDLNIEATITSLHPEQMAAVYAYSPLYSDHAQEALLQVAVADDFDLTIDRLEMSEETDGDRALVTLEGLGATLATVDSVTAIDTDANCVVEVTIQQSTTCPLTQEDYDEMVAAGMFAGATVISENGEWFVSGMPDGIGAVLSWLALFNEAAGTVDVDPMVVIGPLALGPVIPSAETVDGFFAGIINVQVDSLFDFSQLGLAVDIDVFALLDLDVTVSTDPNDPIVTDLELLPFGVDPDVTVNPGTTSIVPGTTPGSTGVPTPTISVPNTSLPPVTTVTGPTITAPTITSPTVTAPTITVPTTLPTVPTTLPTIPGL